MRVVLIHGLGGSPAVWSKVTPGLPDALTPRLPGTARIDEEAHRIGAILGRHDGPFTLVGHSMGGLVATAIAERLPRLVERIILVNTPPTLASRISARSLSERALGVPVIGSMIWNTLPDMAIRKGLSTAFAPGFGVPDLFIQDLRTTGLPALLRSTRAIDAYLGERPLVDRLNALDCPIRVVFGLRDQRVNPSAVDEYRRIPHVQVTTLASSGHTPPWEQPDAVTAAILRGASPASEAPS